MALSARDRVTFELRGLRDPLQALATAQRTTTAALIRNALVGLLQEDSHAVVSGRNDCTTTGVAAQQNQLVKVTLRLPAAHALALATRARAAEISQGAYVAALIDGSPPPPLPPDHSQAVAALVGSTDRLAAMSADLNAFMRLLGRGSSPEVERYRAGIMSLADDVRDHLAQAAVLVATLRSFRRSR